MARGLAVTAACVLAATACSVAGATVYQGTHAARVWEQQLLASGRSTLSLGHSTLLAAECGLFAAGTAGAVPLYVCHFELGRRVGADPPRCMSVVYFTDRRVDPAYPGWSISCRGAPT